MLRRWQASSMLRLIVRRVVHDVGIVLAGEDVAGAAHVGGELVDLVEAPIDRLAAQTSRIAQVADEEIVGLGLGELGILEVDAADPEALRASAA